MENIFLIDVVYVHIQVIHGVILLLRHEKRCRHTDTVLANVWGFGKFFVIITEFFEHYRVVSRGYLTYLWKYHALKFPQV